MSGRTRFCHFKKKVQKSNNFFCSTVFNHNSEYKWPIQDLFTFLEIPTDFLKNKNHLRINVRNKSCSICSKLLLLFFIFDEIPKMKELGPENFFFIINQSISQSQGQKPFEPLFLRFHHNKKNQIIHKLSQIITHQYHHGNK